MCDPVSVLAAGSLAVEVGGKVADYIGQSKQAKANKNAALAAQREETAQVNLRAYQERQSAKTSIMQADRQARMADAEARVSAGEAGVKGASVDALLNDISNQDSEFRTETNTNLNNTLDQLQQQRRAIQVNTQNEINTNLPPSPVGLGLNILGAGLNTAGFLIQRKNPTPKP